MRSAIAAGLLPGDLIVLDLIQMAGALLLGLLGLLRLPVSASK